MEGFVDLEGTPDIVIEVVSRHSVHKDTVVLRELYARARIPEYWLVDARGERLELDILRRGRGGYARTPKRGDWVASRVLRMSFLLTRGVDEVGNPEYALEVK